MIFFSSGDVNYPSSDFVLTEEEMAECLRSFDEVMEKKDYA